MVFKAFGGDKRDRTADLLNAIQALSQLSYTPIFGFAVKQRSHYTTFNRKVKGFLLFIICAHKEGYSASDPNRYASVSAGEV